MFLSGKKYLQSIHYNVKKKEGIRCHLQTMWSRALKIQMNLDKSSKELKLDQPTA